MDRRELLKGVVAVTVLPAGLLMAKPKPLTKQTWAAKQDEPGGNAEWLKIGNGWNATEGLLDSTKKEIQEYHRKFAKV